MKVETHTVKTYNLMGLSGAQMEAMRHALMVCTPPNGGEMSQTILNLHAEVYKALNGTYPHGRG